MNQQVEKREKIVILGGGVAALTTAYELTNVPDWQNKYEITLYQLGWRLGGKCASGRNPKIADRIEEHGLHILCGFYENAFHAIRGCYGEMVESGLRAPDAPNARWDEAFSPKDNVDLCEYVNGEWIPWTLIRKSNHRTPGEYNDGSRPLSPWDCVQRLISHVLALWGDSPHSKGECQSTLAHLASRHPTMWRGLAQKFETCAIDVCNATACDLLHIAEKFAASLPHEVEKHDKTDHLHLLWLLERFVQYLWEKTRHQIESHTETRRLVIEIGLAYGTVRGLIHDRVLEQGFDAIDDYDYKSWLERNLEEWPGDIELITLSAIVRGTYDLVFGFRHGDAWTPSNPGQFCLSAGAGLNFMMRLLFDYSGAIYYRMMGGTGDVILTPFYQVLEKRGVKFNFFHRVRNLGLGESSHEYSIEQIEMGRQVRLKSDRYEPLYNVKNLPCWPSEPRYEQIDDEQARLLQEQNIDLESSWTPWVEHEETVVLKKGADFDRVVYAISIGSVPFTCAELVAAKPEWQKMVRDVESVKTMGVQYWLKPTLKELGWNQAPAMLDAFREPLNSWADHADLLPLENWPSENAPQDFAILCGAMSDDPAVDAPFFDHEFPSRQKARVLEAGVKWLKEYSRDLWPLGSPNGQFDWNLLIDQEEREGEARMDAQFWKANIDPSERYVLSVPGSTRSRLAPADSGFDNLVLAGDWTLNSINAGCVEATVTSGMLASRAISGFPTFIFAED